MCVRRLCKAFDIKDGQRRIRDRFAEYAFGFPEKRVEFFVRTVG
jgi:hypothetical protein